MAASTLAPAADFSVLSISAATSVPSVAAAAAPSVAAAAGSSVAASDGSEVPSAAVSVLSEGSSFGAVSSVIPSELSSLTFSSETAGTSSLASAAASADGATAALSVSTACGCSAAIAGRHVPVASTIERSTAR